MSSKTENEAVDRISQKEHKEPMQLPINVQNERSGIIPEKASKICEECN